jgi:hypothetical protein
MLSDPQKDETKILAQWQRIIVVGDSPYWSFHQGLLGRRTIDAAINAFHSPV